MRFSSSYINERSNYIIIGLENNGKLQNNNQQDVRLDVLAVIQNIIQRGTPTKPSKYLLEKLGTLEHIENRNIELISNKDLEWDSEIKGYEDNKDYPALTFYNEYIYKYLGEYSFIKNLILPEAYLEDIIDKKVSYFKDSQVDFYLREARLVIEIDGLQHNEYAQRMADFERDQEFERYNIKVVRISAECIKEENENLRNKMIEIKEILEAATEIRELKKIYANEEYEYDERYLNYEMCMRFQLCILNLLNNRKLLNKKELKIYIDSEKDRKIFEVAYKDICLYFENLTNLVGSKKVLPKLNLTTSNSEGTEVDIDLFKFYDKKELDDKSTIYIRKDYFRHDYFKIAGGNKIKYKIEEMGKRKNIESLYFMLENLFGYTEFNEGQIDIIKNILALKDTIGILPTGSGKSVCYQIAALLQPGVSFVVEPIVSLICDQKENLDKFNITRTEYITSEKTGREKGEILENLRNGKYQILWISPERFQREGFRKSIAEVSKKIKIVYAMVDEVHCLSEWGHDFRTSYLTLLKTIRRICANINCVGLTATASQFVLEDLKREFNVESKDVKSVSSMVRKELKFNIKPVLKNNKVKEIEEIIKSYEEQFGEGYYKETGENSKCGLIFSNIAKGGPKNKGCVNVSNELEASLGIEVGQYYSALDNKEKTETQRKYTNHEISLLVATKAFGMGINKKNVRYTIHKDLPWSIEAFYQEAGRAGRDSDKTKDSYCTVLYTGEKNKEFVEKIFMMDTTVEEIKNISRYLSGDLSTIMFLWGEGNDDLNTEVVIMKQVLNKLVEKQKIVCNTELMTMQRVQKALYRASLLGIVSDWTIEYGKENIINAELAMEDISPEKIKGNLIKYIQKYDVKFDIDHLKNIKYNRIFNDDSLKENTKYIKVLLQWVYDNITYNRKQTIKNMINLCESGKSQEEIESYIDNYFSFSDRTIILDNIINKPNDVNLWIKYFRKPMKVNEIDYVQRYEDKEGLINLEASVERYIESYKNNAGLNFIIGILGLVTANLNTKIVKERLDDAFDTVKGLSSKKELDIFKFCKEISVNIESEQKEILGEILMKNYPRKAEDVYKMCEDKNSLTYLLDKYSSKLNKVRRRMTW